MTITKMVEGRKKKATNANSSYRYQFGEMGKQGSLLANRDKCSLLSMYTETCFIRQFMVGQFKRQGNDSQYLGILT